MHTHIYAYIYIYIYIYIYNIYNSEMGDFDGVAMGKGMN